MDYSESSNVIATCISRQLSSQDGKNRRPTASSQKSSYYGRQTTASTQKSSHGGYLHPNTAAEFGSNFDWNESEYSMTFSPSSDFLSKNHSRMFEHTASSKGHDVQILTCKTSKISGMDDTSKFSKTEKQAAGAHTAKLTFGIESSKVKGKSNFTADERKVENSQQRRESSRYSDAEASLDEGQPLAGDTTNAHPTGHKSCDHTHANTQAEVRHASLPINPNQSGLDMNLNFSQEETASVKSFPKRSSSVIFKGSQGAAAVHRKSVNYSIVKLDSLHVVALKKIQNSSWYPKDRQTQLQSDPEGLTEVVNTLSK